MSCCSGNCGCGSGCKCGNGCGGCGMYPDVEKATIIDGVGAAPKKMFSEMSIAAEGGHGHGHGCKCGPNCNCDPCNC